MFKQKNGITLIALVVTIVILLVLAGIAINLSMGENGLIGKAKTAVDKYKQAGQNEQMLIAKYENEIDGYISGNRDYELEIKKLNERIKELENLNSYSTEEKVVGTWIDGKPIYQKTIEITNMPTPGSGWTYTSTGINNIDVLVDISINWYDTVDGNFITLGRTSNLFFMPIVSLQNGFYCIGLNSSANVNWNTRTTKRFATIQYTKLPTPSPTGN